MTIAPDPIILFGAPRSGTTFLNRLLNSHPEMHITHEMRLFAWAHESLHVAKKEDRLLVTHREDFVKHVTNHFAGMIRDFYATQWPHVRYWGDKNPHYADMLNRGCLDTIRRIFPGAKFIHIIRDGRDVVASIVRRKHADGTPWASIEEAAWTWADHTAIGTAFGRKVGSASYHELRYEDLVADEYRASRTLFEFLGIPLHAAVDEFCQQQREKRSFFSSPTRDIASGDVGRSEWSQTFSEEERALALHILAPRLAEFGYGGSPEARGEATAS